MNDYQFKLVKIKGEFTWHNHTHTDETFIVLEGSMGIEFRDRTVQLSEKEMIVVRRGEDHKPSLMRSAGCCWLNKGSGQHR